MQLAGVFSLETTGHHKFYDLNLLELREDLFEIPALIVDFSVCSVFY